MTVAALLLAALLALACVLYVSLPFLREPVANDDTLHDATPEERELVRQLEERDRALAALKELEFDHRTGKITDEDYRELIGPLRQQAAAALAALAPKSPAAPPEPKVDARA